MYVLEKRNNMGVHLGKNFMTLYQSVLHVYSILCKDRYFKNYKKNSLQGIINETLQFCGHGGVDNGINN